MITLHHARPVWLTAYITDHARKRFFQRAAKIENFRTAFDRAYPVNSQWLATSDFRMRSRRPNRTYLYDEESDVLFVVASDGPQPAVVTTLGPRLLTTDTTVTNR